VGVIAAKFDALSATFACITDDLARFDALQFNLIHQQRCASGCRLLWIVVSELGRYEHLPPSTRFHASCAHRHDGTMPSAGFLASEKVLRCGSHQAFWYSLCRKTSCWQAYGMSSPRVWPGAPLAAAAPPNP
jgi:hypothetical protein